MGRGVMLVNVMSSNLHVLAAKTIRCLPLTRARAFSGHNHDEEEDCAAANALQGCKDMDRNQMKTTVRTNQLRRHTKLAMRFPTRLG